MLYTNEFIEAFRNVEKAKNPELPYYLYANAYAYLTGLLTSLIETGASVKKAQAIIDECTQDLIKELSDLSDKVSN